MYVLHNSSLYFLYNKRHDIKIKDGTRMEIQNKRFIFKQEEGVLELKSHIMIKIHFKYEVKCM